MSERKKFSGRRPKPSGESGKKFSNTGGRGAARGRRDEEQSGRGGKRTDKKPYAKKGNWKPPFKKKNPSFQKTKHDDGSTRLNKYLSNSGISSRREADDLIKSGMVEVNGKVVVEMGYRVMEGDVVKYAGEKITPEKPVYILLNKPKDYSTSMKATVQRTAFSLLNGIGQVRVSPIGKMDRNTTGLLVFTNDGDLAKKLTQQRSTAKHLYHAHLDKNMKKEHIESLMEGIELEDGTEVKVDDVSYVHEGKDKKQVGIELRNGKNGIVRDIFDFLGYNVIKLDRVMYAGLSKKDLPRGKWRYITEKELVNLKMLK